MLLIVWLTACGTQTQGDSSGNSNPNPSPLSGKTVTYASSDEVFLNPERGFRIGVQFGYGIGSRSMTGLDLSGMRGRGYSMIHAYISLEPFQNGPIAEDYLAQLRQRFAQMRQAGVKASVRFWYAWGGTATVPKSRILQHIEQLGPLLKENTDVISVMQAGFVGAWGEWHSHSGLSDQDKREIFQALARVVPQERKIQLRYVEALRLFAPQGFSEAQAFDAQQIASRLGHHNDCFMVNQSDAGTYAWNDPQRTADRNYLAEISKYMPVGGEMCGDVPEAGSDPYNRRTPEGQLAELARFHWSFIANDFGNVERWRQWGIYDTIARKLGYRLALVQSVVPEVAAGGRLRLSLTLRNEGWAAPYNPRPVRIVLRNPQSGQVYAIPVNAEPRRWYAGSQQTLQVDQPLPAGIPAGSYEVLLHLPDGHPSLAARPEYAIRLANPGVWEAHTGYNRLNQTVRVP
nr:DUF4832 domain-containing protein [Meiothermus sp. CFH 77666]